MQESSLPCTYIISYLVRWSTQRVQYKKEIFWTLILMCYSKNLIKFLILCVTLWIGFGARRSFMHIRTGLLLVDKHCNLSIYTHITRSLDWTMLSFVCDYCSIIRYYLKYIYSSTTRKPNEILADIIVLDLHIIFDLLFGHCCSYWCHIFDVGSLTNIFNIQSLFYLYLWYKIIPYYNVHL